MEVSFFGTRDKMVAKLREAADRLEKAELPESGFPEVEMVFPPSHDWEGSDYNVYEVQRPTVKLRFIGYETEFNDRDVEPMINNIEVNIVINKRQAEHFVGRGGVVIKEVYNARPEGSEPIATEQAFEIVAGPLETKHLSQFITTEAEYGLNPDGSEEPV